MVRENLTFDKIRRRIEKPSGAPDTSTTLYCSPSVLTMRRTVASGSGGLSSRQR